MSSKNIEIIGFTLLFLSIMILGCGPSTPEPINTDFKVEFKTRTFGGGVSYLVPNKGVINTDGSIEFYDLKVEDAVRACLCDYQKINCNGASSKVIIKNINQSLANYVFIDDVYKGKTKDPDLISQAIMANLEKGGVITVNERIQDIPRFIVEEINEGMLKKHFKENNGRFQNQTRCNANQTQRNNNPSSASMKHISSTKKFLGDLSFCLGVDIFLDETIKNKSILDKDILFDIETTDDAKKLSSVMAKYGLTVKKYLVKSKVLEVNVTPQMINLTKEGSRK